MKKAIIFRDFLLSRSETFIQAQAESLREFKPVYVGLRRATPSLPIVPDVLLTASTGNLAKAAAFAYRWTAIAPRFHARVGAEHASLVHAHFAPDGAAAVPMCRILSLPLVVTLHGYDVTFEDSSFRATLVGRLYLEQRSRLFQEASMFLCVSRSIRDKAISRGFPEEKLQVHYTGIDCSRFSMPQTSVRDPGLILFVGRLVEMKGCEYAIRAMAALRNKSAKLVMIGDGPLRPALEKLAHALGVNAVFLGTQPQNIVREWLAKARVFCVPSVTTPLGHAEGLGMVFLEAQAMGTPVVSSRSGGIPEAVKDGETGLLAAERDAPALAALIDRFLAEQPLWERCSLLGRKHVAANFDIGRQAVGLEDFYNQICESYRRETAPVPA